jgi:hypothetical protein
MKLKKNEIKKEKKSSKPGLIYQTRNPLNSNPGLIKKLNTW